MNRVLAAFISAFAATLLAVPGVNAQVLALRGGTAHTPAGDEVPNATIVIENGRITAVGVDSPRSLMSPDSTSTRDFSTRSRNWA